MALRFYPWLTLHICILIKNCKKNNSDNSVKETVTGALLS